MSILLEIMKHTWAMAPSSFDALLDIAEAGRIDPEARGDFHALDEGVMASVVADVGVFEEGNRYTSTAGNRAFVFVDGPIVPRSGNMQKTSGLVAVSQLAAEVRRLEEDDYIEEMFFVFDSPGGVTTGVSELAELIAGCKKRTTAYVYGMAASAAYWLASQADRIVAADTAVIGSIGTVLTARKPADSDRVVKVVSSQSPRKQPEPGSKIFSEEAQNLVDSLTDIFIRDVARGRGVDVETVATEYGRGGVFVAGEALERGMVDDVMSLSALLKTGPASAEVTTIEAKEESMDLATLKAEHPELVAELHEQGKRTAEADIESRLSAAVPILSSDAYPAKIKAFAADVVRGKCSVEAMTGAVAGYDAAMEAAAEAQAVEASVAVTPVEEPEVGKARTYLDDGLILNEADYKMALEAKGGEA